uniref:Uncharacterized protein n=1 Tax=Knipowitschia caucasica TaxID=637954 RepID=A0AAV2JAD0_KNICA
MGGWDSVFSPEGKEARLVCGGVPAHSRCVQRESREQPTQKSGVRVRGGPACCHGTKGGGGRGEISALGSEPEQIPAVTDDQGVAGD